jgi:hypothetical protein
VLSCNSVSGSSETHDRHVILQEMYSRCIPTDRRLDSIVSVTATHEVTSYVITDFVLFELVTQVL